MLGCGGTSNHNCIALPALLCTNNCSRARNYWMMIYPIGTKNAELNTNLLAEQLDVLLRVGAAEGGLQVGLQPLRRVGEQHLRKDMDMGVLC